jgi:hypothetical protein
VFDGLGPEGVLLGHQRMMDSSRKIRPETEQPTHGTSLVETGHLAR